ncbi:MAG: hypothetical protein AB9907_12370 [Flexilinea sp.]
MQKKIISVILFFLVFLISFQFVNDLLFTKTELNAAKDLILEKENSIDVLFLGTSHVYCGVNPLEIWNQTGIPSFNVVSNRQPIWSSYGLLKEALKHQKPKAVFFDVLGATDYVEGLIDSDRGINATHLAFDPVPLSISKILDILQIDEISNKQEMIFPIIYNHKRLFDNSLNSFDFSYVFKKQRNIDKGFVLSVKTEPVEKPPVYPDGMIPMTPVAEKYLVKIIELCKKENIPLVLFKTPSSALENFLMQLTGIAEVGAEYDVPFLDFNRLYDETGLDFKTDFIDGGHLNVHGAKKISDYLGKYLQENFDLADKRDDPDYTEWNFD